MDRKLFALLGAMGTPAFLFAQAYGTLEINDVRARFHSHGLISEDLINQQAAFEVPVGGGAHTMYSAGLWIGGVSPGGQLKLAAQMYEPLGEGDYYPGPLTTDGDASITPEVSLEYDHVWSILRSDVDQHLLWISCNGDPECIADLFPNGYTVPPSFLNWPAIGDTEAGQALYLAPFFDYNGDGDYDPFSGDYPCVPGDQALFSIFNDKTDLHLASNSQPIGIEVHMMPFAYNTGDPAIDQTVFVHYRIINRGTQTLENTYIGFFQDFDIGCSNDDYVGTDAKRGVTYGLNSDNFDENCLGSTGYGEKPPTFGSMILKGARMDFDATDNAVENMIPNWNGTGYEDGAIDNERSGLAYSHHFYREGADPATTDPNTGQHFYNALRGIWKNNVPQSYGGTGYSLDPNAVPARFMFPGDSDPLGVGTGGTVLPPWTEASAGNAAYDPRVLSAMAPFTLEPGMEQDILIAFIYARSPIGEPLASVDALLARADSIRAFAQNIPGLMAPGSPCDELSMAIVEPLGTPAVLEVFPVPASDRILVHTGEAGVGAQLHVFDGRGALVLSTATNGLTTNVDITSLPPGLYTVRAFDRHAMRIGRFVKE